MSHIRYRRATPADQATLVAMQHDAPMEGWVRLQLLREPDYFAADRLMGEAMSILAETQTSPPEPVGMCRLARLPVHVNGVPAEAGYLAGLRVLPRFRHRLTILRDGFATLRELGLPAEPLPACFTSVGAGNAPARRILEATLPQMPAYCPLGSMHTLSFASSRGRPGKLLRAATAADIPALASFFNRQASAWQFAPCLSEEWLTALGPEQGLSIGDFLLFEDATGLRACIALWDQRAFKQTRIAGYRAPLDVLRPLWNLFARLGRRVVLPAAGAQLDQGLSRLLCLGPRRGGVTGHGARSPLASAATRHCHRRARAGGHPSTAPAAAARTGCHALRNLHRIRHVCQHPRSRTRPPRASARDRPAVKLEQLTLLRPNMGDYRSSDALTPLALGILAARTPPDVAVKLLDERVEALPADDPAGPRRAECGDLHRAPRLRNRRCLPRPGRAGGDGRLPPQLPAGGGLAACRCHRYRRRRRQLGKPAHGLPCRTPATHLPRRQRAPAGGLPHRPQHLRRQALRACPSSCSSAVAAASSAISARSTVSTSRARAAARSPA